MPNAYSCLTELTTLSNLEVLNLGYNAITGEIPPSVADLTSLKALSFARNELNGSWPVEGSFKSSLCEVFNNVNSYVLWVYKRSKFSFELNMISYNLKHFILLTRVKKHNSIHLLVFNNVNSHVLDQCDVPIWSCTW